MIERRKNYRYPLAVPAVVNSNVKTVGRTKDISTGGLFLVLDQVVRNDTDFDVTIALPIGMHVQAVARIVRTQEWVEGGKRFIGVGAVIRQHEIVRTAPSGRL
jgi:hypothetical protein